MCTAFVNFFIVHYIGQWWCTVFRARGRNAHFNWMQLAHAGIVVIAIGQLTIRRTRRNIKSRANKGHPYIITPKMSKLRYRICALLSFVTIMVTLLTCIGGLSIAQMHSPFWFSPIWLGAVMNINFPLLGMLSCWRLNVIEHVIRTSVCVLRRLIAVVVSSVGHSAG